MDSEKSNKWVVESVSGEYLKSVASAYQDWKNPSKDPKNSLKSELFILNFIGRDSYSKMVLNPIINNDLLSDAKVLSRLLSELISNVHKAYQGTDKAFEVFDKVSQDLLNIHNKCIALWIFDKFDVMNETLHYNFVEHVTKTFFKIAVVSVANTIKELQTELGFKRCFSDLESLCMMPLCKTCQDKLGQSIFDTIPSGSYYNGMKTTVKIPFNETDINGILKTVFIVEPDNTHPVKLDQRCVEDLEKFSEACLNAYEVANLCYGFEKVQQGFLEFSPMDFEKMSEQFLKGLTPESTQSHLDLYFTWIRSLTQRLNEVCEEFVQEFGLELINNK